MAKIKPYLLELFYAVSGALAIFAVLEIVWPGIVLAYLNINFVLLFWLIISIIILIIQDK